MKELLTLNFWLDVGSRDSGIFVEFSVFLFSLALAISARIIWKKRKELYKTIYRELWKRAISFLVTNSVFGFLLWFFVYEKIPFLSARFWFLLWFLEMAIFIFWIWLPSRLIPDKKEGIEKNKEYKKYIP